MTADISLWPQPEHADDDATEAARDAKGPGHKAIHAFAQLDLVHRQGLAKTLLGKPVTDVR